ncbi:MAG: Clp1/GlmU family protein [Chloroflexota bacterium]
MNILTEPTLDIPPIWKQLDLEALHGVVFVVGGVGVGKSTFARYLFRSLRAGGRRIAFLDGDPGQSWLGPPTTLTCAFDLDAQQEAPIDIRANLAESVRRVFIGSISPSGHMLPAVVGGARLVQAALSDGAQVIVYDTSGLIDPQQGGLALKLAKVELLRPATVIGIQAGKELEPLLTPLRRLRRMKVVTLRPSPSAQRRDLQARKSHRTRQFARYFAHARSLALDWTRLTESFFQ